MNFILWTGGWSLLKKKMISFFYTHQQPKWELEQNWIKNFPAHGWQMQKAECVEVNWIICNLKGGCEWLLTEIIKQTWCMKRYLIIGWMKNSPISRGIASTSISIEDLRGARDDAKLAPSPASISIASPHIPHFCQSLFLSLSLLVPVVLLRNRESTRSLIYPYL